MYYLVYKYREDWDYEDYIVVKIYVDDKKAAYDCMHKMRKRENSGFLYRVEECEMRIL